LGKVLKKYFLNLVRFADQLLALKNIACDQRSLEL
jgi:hypothetical protein